MSDSQQRGFLRRHVARRTAIAWLSAGGAIALAACSAPTVAPAKPAATPAPAGAGAAKPAATPAGAAKPAAQATAAPKRLEVSTFKVMDVTGLYENVFTRMANEKGFYTEVGLTVEQLENGSGNVIQKALLTGDADVVEYGLVNHIIPAAKGEPIKVIGAPKPRVAHVLFGQHSIASVKDLVGKSIGHGGVNSSLHLETLMLLDQNGIDPSKVEFVTVGSSTEVAKAVFAGKVDAGIGGVDLIPESEKFQNVRVVANLAEELPNFVRILLGTSQKTIKEKPEALQAFLTAYTKGYRYAMDNKEESGAFAVKLLGRDRKDMDDSFDWYLKNKVLNPDLTISADAMKASQDLNVKVGVQEKFVPFDQIVDLSFQKRAVEALGGPYKYKA